MLVTRYNNDALVVEAGPFTVFVGGGQPRFMGLLHTLKATVSVKESAQLSQCT
jgi:hypothetical protein